MSAAVGRRWADGIARSWARTYTRGLPSEARHRRRQELAADLHDHAALAGRSPAQQAHVLGRVLWGIPADLSWRRAAVAHARHLPSGATMTLRTTSTVAFGLLALFELVSAGSVISGGYWPWGLLFPLGALAIVVALVTRDDAPRRATVLLVGAAVIPALLLYWMAVIFVPVAIAFIVLAVASEPRSAPPAVA